MPFSLMIDDDLACAFVKWYGNVDVTDILSHKRALEEHPGFRRDIGRFNDHRQAIFTLSGAELRTAAYEFRSDTERHGEHKTVLLVASDLSFGMSRMYGQYRDTPGVDMLITRDLAKALAWLDLPADLGDPFEDMAAE